MLELTGAGLFEQTYISSCAYLLSTTQYRVKKIRKHSRVKGQAMVRSIPAKMLVAAFKYFLSPTIVNNEVHRINASAHYTFKVILKVSIRRKSVRDVYHSAGYLWNIHLNGYTRTIHTSVGIRNRNTVQCGLIGRSNRAGTSNTAESGGG